MTISMVDMLYLTCKRRSWIDLGFLKSFTSFLLAARTEATRMFCTMHS